MLKNKKILSFQAHSIRVIKFKLPKKKDKSKDLSFFIQSEGLVCNRRKAYVITRSVYGITAGVFSSD